MVTTLMTQQHCLPPGSLHGGAGLNWVADFTLGEMGAGMAFSRASLATFNDAVGSLATAGNNVARFDKNPTTGVARGVLVESSSTNSLTQAGTPTTWDTTKTVNGITVTRNSTGVEAGQAYAEFTFNGTATGTYADISLLGGSRVTVANGQTWAGAVSLKMISGGTATLNKVKCSVLEEAAGFAMVGFSESADYRPLLAGGGMVRLATSRTMGSTAVTARLVLFLDMNVGANVNITLRIYAPQAEMAGFASSFISTTGTAVTRSPDILSYTGAGSFLQSGRGTLVVEWETRATAGFPTVLRMDDGTINNYVQLYYNATLGSVAAKVVVGGATVFDGAANGTFSAGTLMKTAIALEAGNYAWTTNGLTPVTSASTLLPGGVNAIRLGRTLTGNELNGWIKKVNFYPTRLSNATLQGVTS